MSDPNPDQKAISLSWYGYFTTQDPPPVAYIIWQKLKPETRDIFRQMAELNLGTHAPTPTR